MSLKSTPKVSKTSKLKKVPRTRKVKAGVHAPSAVVKEDDSTLTTEVVPVQVEAAEPKSLSPEQIFLKEKKIELLTQKLKLQRELPHLYGWKLYPWQREYLEDTNHEQFVTAANQIGKSTIQVIKAVDWATNISKWPSLWRSEPRSFWYMYPSQELANQEILKKWIPDVLPRGSMKDHPIYGWSIEKKGPHINAVHFNSGVSIYIKTYSQDISYLQAATCWAIFADEELPDNYWDEINFRRQAHHGYFSMVFTATLGQKLWFDTMERVGEDIERFKGSYKRQVSLFDCKTFEDGTQSHWSDAAIARVISFCKSEAEVQRRVYGRFVLDGGLKYSGFNRKKNMCAPHPLPKGWRIYAGVDIGAGGTANHPSTIVFCAVNAAFTEARVIRAWKGDKKVTTSMDIVQKLKSMMIGYDIATVFYDYHAKDFGTMAMASGLPVVKADKSHETGEAVLNVLFKHEKLKVFELAETEPLVYELTTLLIETDKRRALDDLVDALRYCLTKLPFNWDKIGSKPPGAEVSREVIPEESPEAKELRERKSRFRDVDDGLISIEQEIEAANELYDYDQGFEYF